MEIALTRDARDQKGRDMFALILGNAALFGCSTACGCEFHQKCAFPRIFERSPDRFRDNALYASDQIVLQVELFAHSGSFRAADRFRLCSVLPHVFDCLMQCLIMVDFVEICGKIQPVTHLKIPQQLFPRL